MKKLENKVAIITGAAAGMGKAIAQLFAQEGAKVTVSDINLEGAETVAKEIADDGGEAIAVKTDVSSEEDIQVLIDATLKAYNTVDILVNNAGIMDNFTPVASITDEQWDKVFAVNTTGPMRTIRKVMPIFLEKESGVILNISSVGGLRGSRAGVAYTASKHAVIGLTKNIGFQYAPKGIRCNAIAPGAVATEIGATITAPDPYGMERAMVGMQINPGTGQPVDIANTALFLVSDDSGFINGTVLTADAGWTAY